MSNHSCLNVLTSGSELRADSSVHLTHPVQPARAPTLTIHYLCTSARNKVHCMLPPCALEVSSAAPSKRSHGFISALGTCASALWCPCAHRSNSLLHLPISEVTAEVHFARDEGAQSFSHLATATKATRSSRSIRDHSDPHVRSASNACCALEGNSRNVAAHMHNRELSCSCTKRKICFRMMYGTSTR